MKKKKKSNLFGLDDFHDMISELHLRMFMFICCSPFSLNKGSVRLSVGVKSNAENPAISWLTFNRHGNEWAKSDCSPESF